MTHGYALKLDFVPGGHGCIFRCGKPASATLPVAMNVSRNGQFLARATDEGFTSRVDGVAHEQCYQAWCAVAYGLPLLERSSR